MAPPAAAEHELRVTADSGVGSAGLPLYTAAQLGASPSVQQGMDGDTERRHRLQYTQFITELGMSLTVPQWCIYTAVFLCHHYFAKRSFQLSDKYLIAVACLYLACKIQESPKYLRDVVKHAEAKKWGGWARSHPLEARKWEDMAHLEAVRDSVLVAERAVLYTLSFQLRIQTPYATLLGMQAAMPAGVKHDVVNIAWSLLNDSLKTTVSLMYPPEQLAAACVYVAYGVVGVAPPRDASGRSFCEYTRTPAAALQEITDTLLSVYQAAVLPKDAAAVLPALLSSSDAANGVSQQQQQPGSPSAGPDLQLRDDRVVAVQPAQQQQPQQQQPGPGADAAAGGQPQQQPHQQPQQQQQQQEGDLEPGEVPDGAGAGGGSS